MATSPAMRGPAQLLIRRGQREEEYIIRISLLDGIMRLHAGSWKLSGNTRHLRYISQYTISWFRLEAPARSLPDTFDYHQARWKAQLDGCSSDRKTQAKREPKRVQKGADLVLWPCSGGVQVSTYAPIPPWLLHPWIDG